VLEPIMKGGNNFIEWKAEILNTEVLKDKDSTVLQTWDTREG